MCRSLVDIQSATAEIGRGIKKDRKKPQGKNIMSASATQGGHKKVKYSRLQIKSNFVKQSMYIIIIDGTIQFITIILYCLLLNNA